jgi:hypothetical protein
MAMSASNVEVRELIGWGLDENPFREAMAECCPEALANRTKRASEVLAERECHVDRDALLAEETKSIQHLLTLASQRDDLQRECEELDWTLAVVDLRRLLAFQRRLILDPARQPLALLNQDDWPRLISLAIGAKRSTKHHLVHNKCTIDGLDVSLHSSNPDLQFRLDPKKGGAEFSSLSLHGGSPFFEVAKLRNRWFLRDGYHRAYNLLQAGVHRVPAVVIFARTIRELGATEPWFFGEEQLFSDRPPLVMDFLDQNLTLSYKRMPLRKVIRVRIEESLEPFNETEDVQGDGL